MSKPFVFLNEGIKITAHLLMDDGIAVQGERNEMFLAEGQWLHVVTTLANIKEPYQWLFNEFGLTDDTVRIAMKYAKLKVQSFINSHFEEENLFKFLPYRKLKMHISYSGGRELAHLWADTRPFYDDLELTSSLQNKLDKWGMISHGFNNPIMPISLDLSKNIEDYLKSSEGFKKHVHNTVGIPADRMGPSSEILERWRKEVRMGVFEDAAHAGKYGFFDEQPSSSHWQLFKRWIINLYHNAFRNRKRDA